MIPDWLSLVDVTFVVVALLFAWGGGSKRFCGADGSDSNICDYGSGHLFCISRHI